MLAGTDDEEGETDAEIATSQKPRSDDQMVIDTDDEDDKSSNAMDEDVPEEGEQGERYGLDRDQW